MHKVNYGHMHFVCPVNFDQHKTNDIKYRPIIERIYWRQNPQLTVEKEEFAKLDLPI